MNRRDRQIRFDPLSYVVPVAAGLVSTALAHALGAGGAGKYLLAFVLLTLTVGWLLARSALGAGRYKDDLAGARKTEQGSREEVDTAQRHLPSGATFPVTRRRLGLDVAKAQSTEDASSGPQIWLPSATAARRISLRAVSSGLVVGAVAEDEETLIARVDLAAYRAVYVLLREVDDGRAGATRVPNLARDLVDQTVTIEWLGEMDELPSSDVEAIAASVSAANHAGREAWAHAAKKLPVGDAVRAAILDAAG